MQCNAILQYKIEDNPKKCVSLQAKVFIDMDYIDFPRKLVYRERRGLEDFVEEHEEITLFIDNMLDSYYFSNADGKERALRCFNTAYYLCTIILQCKNHPEWNFAKYCDIAYCGDKDNKIYQAFTLSLVYIFLTHTYYEVPCKKLLKKLHDYINNITHFLRAGDPFLDPYCYSDVCDDLQKDAPDDLLIAEEFIPRKIDWDIFRDVDGPGDQWSRKTNYYDRQEIRKIVDFLGKDEEEKHVLIELIDRDAQRFYGSNGAPYIQNVKPMLEDMDECIYHEYNDAFNQAIAEAEIEELQYQGDVRPLQARIAELEEEVERLNTHLKGVSSGSGNVKHTQQSPKITTTIKEQQQTIIEQQRIIDDYAAKYDPKQKGKDKYNILSGKQHVILYLAVLAHHDRIPNARENLSWELSLIAGRAESYMKRLLKEAITQEECDKTAKLFHETTPFIEKLIKGLPQKLKEDKSEKNRKKVLKGNNS